MREFHTEKPCNNGVPGSQNKGFTPTFVEFIRGPIQQINKMEDEATLYIRQQCLFSFEDALKMQPQTRLERIFITLDLDSIFNKLSVRSEGGPDGYSIASKLRAVLAAKIEQIPNTAALVRRLRSDPVFRYNCGFKVFGSVPSESTFSRFFRTLAETNVLEDLHQALINKAEGMGIIDTKVVAIDSTKINAYEKSKPKKHLSLDGTTADWGVKQNTDGNKIAWFGYKLHVVTDTKSELPIALEVTQASVHDSDKAIALVEQAKKNVNTDPRYYLMDSGYDSVDIYETIRKDHHAQAIIPLNRRGAKQPKAGFDFNGTPICSAGFRMVYWGHHKGINKFRCPHILGKCCCPYGSAWCSESNYGMVVKTRVKDDPRLFCTPHRETENWHKLYNQRSGVERCFGRLKEHLGLEHLKLRGIKKVITHAYLCVISLISTVTAINSVKKEQVAA